MLAIQISLSSVLFKNENVLKCLRGNSIYISIHIIFLSCIYMYSISNVINSDLFQNVSFIL